MQARQGQLAPSQVEFPLLPPETQNVPETHEIASTDPKSPAVRCQTRPPGRRSSPRRRSMHSNPRVRSRRPRSRLRRRGWRAPTTPHHPRERPHRIPSPPRRPRAQNTRARLVLGPRRGSQERDRRSSSTRGSGTRTAPIDREARARSRARNGSDPDAASQPASALNREAPTGRPSPGPVQPPSQSFQRPPGLPARQRPAATTAAAPKTTSASSPLLLTAAPRPLPTKGTLGFADRPGIHDGRWLWSNPRSRSGYPARSLWTRAEENRFATESESARPATCPRSRFRSSLRAERDPARSRTVTGTPTAEIQPRGGHGR